MRRGKKSLCLQAVVALLALFSLGGAVSAQSGLSRSEAMKAVAVVTIPNWKEFSSAEGKFRILFPGEPKLSDEVISVKGWSLSIGDTRWSVDFRDFDSRDLDDEQLRELYQSTLATTIHKGERLLFERNFRLNGRLGSEAAIQSSVNVRYMRALVLKKRLYIMAVYQKMDDGAGNAIPGVVQQFFDSFAYWDVD
jgi:hypothetical protein